MAKNAVEADLFVAPYIKTSLSPGSGVVTYYLRESGVMSALKQLGFDTVGFGCMTCIGNSGPLPESVANAIESVSGTIIVPGGARNITPKVVTPQPYPPPPLICVCIDKQARQSQLLRRRFTLLEKFFRLFPET